MPVGAEPLLDPAEEDDVTSAERPEADVAEQLRDLDEDDETFDEEAVVDTTPPAPPNPDVDANPADVFEQLTEAEPPDLEEG